jgi:hypothetical protein
VCVCVCVREREKERGGKEEKEQSPGNRKQSCTMENQQCARAAYSDTEQPAAESESSESGQGEEKVKRGRFVRLGKRQKARQSSPK